MCYFEDNGMELALYSNYVNDINNLISHAEKKMNLNFLTALNKYYVFKEWHVIIQMSIQFVRQREHFFLNNYRSMYLDSSACETVG